MASSTCAIGLAAMLHLSKIFVAPISKGAVAGPEIEFGQILNNTPSLIYVSFDYYRERSKISHSFVLGNTSSRLNFVP